MANECLLILIIGASGGFFQKPCVCKDLYKMLHRFKIKPVQITTKNPQGNCVCERMHKSMANQIRVMSLQNPPQNDKDEARMIVDTLLANVICALRTGVHSVLFEAPGTIAFRRDIILNIPFIVDLNNMQMVDKYNVCENMKPIDYNYEIGDLVLIRKDTYKMFSNMDERVTISYIEDTWQWNRNHEESS